MMARKRPIALSLSRLDTCSSLFLPPSDGRKTMREGGSVWQAFNAPSHRNTNKTFAPVNAQVANLTLPRLAIA